ncbi:hypothetical protein BJ165DRAFT_271715 [Panaeolus papilionaceus]|nr:hypothetical protein BJ165DRAFT_271715 [Panaeolus papilionaceus]
MKDFLSRCSSLRSFRSYDLGPDALSCDDGLNELPSSIQLKRLWGPCSWSSSPKADWVLSRPQFAMLTHLNSTFSISTAHMLQMLLRTLESLNYLTHMQMQYVSSEDAPILDQILLKPSALKVIILYHFEWHQPENGYDLNFMTATQKDDRRLVRLSSAFPTECEVVEEWISAIYHHRLDTWNIAEGIQKARRAGYFKNKNEALTWVCPSREGLQELLQDWGLAKLAESSELWLDFLKEGVRGPIVYASQRSSNIELQETEGPDTDSD